MLFNFEAKQRLNTFYVKNTKHRVIRDFRLEHYIISVLNLFLVESLNMADRVAFEASPVDKRGFV